MHLDCVIINFS